MRTTMSNLGCAFPRSYFCSVRVEIPRRSAAFSWESPASLRSLQKGLFSWMCLFFLIFLHSKPSFYGGFYIIFQIFNTNKNSLLPKENTGPAYSYGACAQTNPSSLAIRYSSTANCRRVSGWSNIRSPSAFPCMMPFSVSQSTAALASAW